MTSGKFNKYGILIVILLIAIIATSSIIIWLKYRPDQPIEISLAPRPELQGEIYIGGAVNNPGFYPLKYGDSIEDVIQAAGGFTEGADLSQIKLFIPDTKDTEQPQKVNINRAEAWLLQALPGIGETRAQAIIDYRQQNGQFHHTNELMKVEGIGAATYEKIKRLITVAD